MKEQRSHPLGIPAFSGGGVLRGAGSEPAAVTGFDRWLLRRLAHAAGDPPVEWALWDGESAAGPPRDEALGRIVFRDRGALVSTIMKPELGFGDAYSAGRADVEGDLVSVLHAVYRAADAAGPHTVKRSMTGRLPKAEPNTHDGLRRHIRHHYDLGNDFYAQWLDERMVYTCAYFERPDLTLEQAQVAKMDHVCRKVRLEPGMRVVEAGCGWGALALHMAREYGVHVRAFNISHEQIEFARERAREEGIDQRVEFVEDDYRNVDGRFDAFVSIGMLEHVGLENYAELGSVMHRVLEPHGLALVHSVGRNRPSPPNAWLEQRIFPGSHPPSLREMMNVFEPHNFSVLDVENLRLHYARTLEEWLARFDRIGDRVREDYDDHFVRAWRLYLGGCAAAFLSNSIQLFQVVAALPGNNDVPWTRRYMYDA